MNSEVVIEVKNISKNFKIFKDKGFTIKEKLLFKNRREYEERVVLDNISFSINKGQAVGLIGKNGCGKSTILKLLSRILYPNSGSIEMVGRVSALIELGAGFHPDMTGRENIFINASIFGLTRKEIEQRLEDIIKFSELEKFIDNPVRTYSSGMYMRLAFSVAINVDANILLIDEILAVGDINFQSKCFKKLKEIKEKGATIIIVSHSMEQIEQICDRSIWIDNGRIQKDGTPIEVHSKYMKYMSELELNSWDRESLKKAKKIIDKEEIGYWSNGEKLRWGNQKAVIKNTYLVDSKNQKVEVIKSGDFIKLCIKYDLYEQIDDAIFGIGIYRIDGVQCYGTNTRIEKFPMINLKKSGIVELEFTSFNLLSGKYVFDVTIEMGVGIAVDYYKKAIECVVYSDIMDAGIVRLEHKWNIKH